MKIYCLLLLSVILISCKGSENYKTITEKNLFSISIPDDFSLATELNSNASLQYQNAFQDLYVVVINEPKSVTNNYIETNLSSEANLKGYADLLKNSLIENTTNSDFSPFETTQINGLKAIKYSLNAEVENIEIYYKFVYLESKDQYYQVMVWTSKAQKEKFDLKMNTIINSFKEIKSRNRGK